MKTRKAVRKGPVKVRGRRGIAASLESDATGLRKAAKVIDTLSPAARQLLKKKLA